MVLLAMLLGATAHMDFNPDVTLASLSEAEMNKIVSNGMGWLNEEVERLYQIELKRYDDSLEEIEGSFEPVLPIAAPVVDEAGKEYEEEYLEEMEEEEKDKKYSTEGAERRFMVPKTNGRSRAPKQEEDPYYPYIFGTGFSNRREVKVKAVHVVERLQHVRIEKLLPIGLPGLPIIFVGSDGLGYTRVDGRVQHLRVLTNWTDADSTCTCGHGGPQECACCLPGGCLCGTDRGYAGDVCVRCGTEHTACSHASGRGLPVTTAAGAVVPSRTWNTNAWKVLAVAHGNTVTLYRYQEFGVGLWEVGVLSLPKPVTHLGFGITHSSHDGATEVNSFLVVFGSEGSVQQFNEITVSAVSPTFVIGPGEQWPVEGVCMSVHQGEGQLLVTVRSDRYLDVFSLQEDAWRRHRMHHVQRIKGPSDNLLVFRAAFKTYLAIAYRRHITFYRQEGQEFNKVETLYTGSSLPRVEGLVAVNVDRCDDFPVLVAGHGRDLLALVLQYNNTNSSFAVSFQGSLEESISWATAVQYTRNSARFAVLEARGAGATSVVVVRATVVDVAHPIQLQRSVLDEKIQRLQAESNRQMTVVTTTKERLEHIVSVNNSVLADVTITGSVTVTGVLSTGVLRAMRLVFPDTALSNGVTHEEYLNYIHSTRPMQDQSERLLQDIAAIEASLADVVPQSGRNRTIVGQKTILSDGVLDFGTLTVSSLHVAEVRDTTGAIYNVNQTLSSIVRLDQISRIVRGHKTFTTALTVGELTVDFLNDIPVNDLVTANGFQSIAGAVFQSGFRAQVVNLRAGATVAGVNLARAVVLGQSAVLGHVRFANRVVASDVVVESGEVSGLQLSRIYNHALLVTGGRVAGSLHFIAEELTVENLDAKVMMGVDVSVLARSVVYRDEDLQITGTLNVAETVTVEGDLTSGNVNGRPFPDGYALKKSQSLVFTSDVSFRSVVFGEVFFGARGVVDGIAPNRFLTFTTDQTITGRKVIVGGVDIEGHLNINSKILDGVNLDHLFGGSGSSRPTLPSDLRFTLVFRELVSVGRILTEGTVNGIDLIALARDLIYRDEEQVRIHATKTFLNGLTVTNARILGGFNGVDFDSLVTIDSHVVIGGVITFSRDVTFRSLVTSRIDGVDLSAVLANALFLNKPGQIFTGRKVFLRPVSVGSLIIEGGVRGVDLRNLVTRSGNQTFTAPQILQSANFASIRTHSIQMSPGFKVNGFSFSELAKRRLTLREPVSHTATLTIDGTVEVVGGASIEIVNGINLEQLKSTVVTDDANYTIEGSVSFASLRVQGSVTTQGSVGGSGVSIRNVANNAIRLSGDNQVSGRLSFERVEVQGEVVVDGLVEGVNLGRLHQDAVYTDVNHQTITGMKVFEEGFAVRGNINTERTNGVDLSTSLFSRTTDQIITASIDFKNVKALRNLLLQGLFNNIDLRKLTRESLVDGEGEERVVEGNITFTNRITVRNLVLKGTLDGFHVSAVLTDAVRLEDTAVTINSIKTFTSGISFKNLHVELLNGRSLDNFLSTLVTRSRSRTLTGLVRVRGIVTAPWVTARHLTVEGTIDGVDYRALRSKVVFLSGLHKVAATLIFTEGLSVRGNVEAEFLNRVSLMHGYLTATTKQTFDMDLTITSATVNHVNVRGTVNSWNLQQEINRTMLAVGGQTVQGSLTLSGRLVVARDVTVSGRVGREVLVKLSEQVVLLDRNTRVSGSLVFKSFLTVASLRSTTAVVNGVDLAELYRNAWFLDTASVVSSTVFFRSNIVIRLGLFSQGTIDGLDVARAHKEATSAMQRFRNITLEFEDQFERVCRPIAKLYTKLESCTYEPDYISFHNNLRISATPHASTSFSAFGETLLIVSYKGQCYVDLLAWQDGEFILRQRMQGAGFGQHFYLVQDDPERVFLIMAATSEENAFTCTSTDTTVWQVTPSGLQIHQKLGEAWFVSEAHLPEVAQNRVLLLLHSTPHTLAYTFNHGTRRWDFVATLPPEAGDVVVNPDFGAITVIHDASTNSSTYVSRVVTHTSRGGAKLLFALALNLNTCHVPFFSLKVYREVDGTHMCVAEAVLPTIPSDLAAFYAGSKTAGKFVVAVTLSYHLSPLLYTFSGEMLEPWDTVEDVPGATWVHYVSVVEEGRPFPNHYLIFAPYHHGRHFNVSNDAITTTTTTTTPSPYFYHTSKPYITTAREGDTSITEGRVYRVVMRGSAVPAANITCTRT